MAASVTDFPQRTDVLVVGAGPTGLSLACRLARRGIAHVVVDHAPPGANVSHAAVIHARTLEVLDSIEASAALLHRGVIVPDLVLRDRDHKLVAVPFSELPTKYPFVLMLPQSSAEEVLVERLHSYGSSVLRPVTAVGLQQDADGVTVELWDGSTRSGTPSRRSISARYVVGCDGMHSQVRNALEMPFVSSSSAVSFVAADVHMQWALPRTEVELFFSENGILLVGPLPDDQYRIVAMVDHADHNPTLDEVQTLLAARGPQASAAVVRDMVWSARFDVHDRVATHYRSGRVFLAGDAAHVHSPAAGQGMNAGMQDALYLADRLGDVISGRAHISVLDCYEEERRPIAASVLRVTETLSWIATRGGPVVPGMRNRSLRFLGKVPALRRRLALRMSGLEATTATYRSGARESKVFYVAALVLAALLLGTTFARALELPEKMRAGPTWLTARHSFYPLFTYVGGLIEGGALVASSLLAVKKWRAQRGYTAVVAAAVCLLLAFAIWLTLIRAVSSEIAALDASVVPYRWMALQSQWELSHLSRFVLHLSGFVLLASARP
jgi:2-polyprenyl-6-methoxyphenol hydroxylase-like FAD-dependent oxidoreductase